MCSAAEAPGERVAGAAPQGAEECREGRTGRGKGAGDPEAGEGGEDSEADRLFRRVSSADRYAAATDMFAARAGPDDAGTVSIIRRHAAQLAELNKQCLAGGAPAAGRECSLM